MVANIDFSQATQNQILLHFAPPPVTAAPTPVYILLSGRLVTPVLCFSRLQLQEHLENALKDLAPGMSAEITLQTLVPDVPQTAPTRKFVFTMCDSDANLCPSFEIEEVGVETYEDVYVSSFIMEFLPFDE